MHIVSNVEGDLADHSRRARRLGGGLSASTVSGAPKVRAMEIIDELEKEKRGIYAGCVGYFSAAPVLHLHAFEAPVRPAEDEVVVPILAVRERDLVAAGA